MTEKIPSFDGISACRKSPVRTGLFFNVYDIIESVMKDVDKRKRKPISI